MDEFLKIVHENIDSISDKEANEVIVSRLMQRGLKGSEKCDGYLDAFDSEPLFNNKLYRGNIYIFGYEAKFPTKYVYKGKSFLFEDNMPIVLMTGQSSKCIRGINLNFCPRDLKTLIINTVSNLDDTYLNKTVYDLIKNKNTPISDKIYSFLSKDDAEKILIDKFNEMYKANYGMLFRNYNVSFIKEIRLVEPWQWKFLPFLTYESTLKGEILKAIQDVNGFSNVKL